MKRITLVALFSFFNFACLAIFESEEALPAWCRTKLSEKLTSEQHQTIEQATFNGQAWFGNWANRLFPQGNTELDTPTAVRLIRDLKPVAITETANYRIFYTTFLSGVG